MERRITTTNQALSNSKLSEEEFIRLNGVYEANMDISKLAELWGFKNEKEYKEHSAKLYSEMQLLLVDYPQLTLKNTAAFELVESALTNLYVPTGSSDCYDRYRSCINIADGVLIVETAACIGAIFIPFVGPALGPTCQAGAVLIHAGMTQQCGYEYEDCQDGVG